MKKTNLFIIGQHKSGTSAMRVFLKQHPDIFFPERKEMQHFESDLLLQRLAFHRIITPNLLKWYNILPKNYQKHYKSVKNERVLGDKSTSYLFSKTAAGEIFNYNPEAKIIAMFREPVSYLYSLHSQNLYNLYENEENFKKALELEKFRKKGMYLTRRMKGIAHLMFYKERIDYANQLRRFLKLFPKRQIKCILFEDFKKDNQGILKEVFEFLEINSDFVSKTFTVNPAKKRKYKKIKGIITPFAMTGIPKKLIPGPVYRKLSKIFDSNSTIYCEREPLSNELVQELKEKFKDNVKDFNDILHQFELLPQKRDLMEFWGYDNIILNNNKL